MENVDWASIINVEQKRGTQQFYLTIKRIKIRYRDPNSLTYFNHPFDMDNKVKLMDDVHLDEPLSEVSLSTDFDAVDLDSKRGKRNATSREEVDAIGDAGDLFDFAASLKGKKKIS